MSRYLKKKIHSNILTKSLKIILVPIWQLGILGWLPKIQDGDTHGKYRKCTIFKP